MKSSKPLLAMTLIALLSACSTLGSGPDDLAPLFPDTA